MLEKLKKLKENKILNTIYNVLYYAIFAIFVLILIVVLLQRVSNNSVGLGGFRIFNIITKSMEPKYMVGDVLLSKEVKQSELKVGDDVVYLGEKSDFAGKYVTHQIVRIEKNSDGSDKFYTKGLANEIEDPSINGSQIKGVIIYKIKILSYISKIIANLYSMYFIVFVPIGILIFINVLNFSKKGKEDTSESDKDNKDDIGK